VSRLKKVTYQAFCKSPKKYLKDVKQDAFAITMFGKIYAIIGRAEDVTEVEGAQFAKEEEKPRFDFQKAEYCQSCRKYVPSILMAMHSHVVHGL